jgi:lysyl-tRNA synthetase class 2
MGVLDLVSALTRAERSRLHLLRAYIPGGVVNASTAVTLATGVLLILLASGLRRHKRRAWVLTVLLLALSVLTHLLKGLDVEESAVAAALLAGVIALRGEFTALGDPRSRWRAPGAFIVLSLVSLVLGVIFVALREDAVAGPLRTRDAIAQAAEGLVGVSGPVAWQNDRYGMRSADQVSDVLLGMGLLVGFTTLYFFLRPAKPAPRLSERDQCRLRELLDRYGDQDSLGYFALRNDKSVIWSPTGKAAVAYRVMAGVMLASGDPLGDPEAWPGAIGAFLTEAQRHAWIPAVMGCSEAAGHAWSRMGLAVLELGDEAILDVASFTLEGRAMRNVRQAVARARRAGYTCEVSRVRDVAPADLGQLQAWSAAWRGAETERGFSMALGRIGELQDGDSVLVTASSNGSPKAFLHLVPWGRTGLSLDLMRRARSADNGLNELLIADLLRACSALGITRVSLNFAVFRSALERGEALGAGPLSRAWRSVLVGASRWWQIETLYRFNAKFHPRWEPRYVCFPAVSDLPRVAVAALRAEAFLVFPHQWRRQRRAVSRAGSAAERRRPSGDASYRRMEPTAEPSPGPAVSLARSTGGE